MRILAISTTTEVCSVALYRDNLVYSITKNCLREQTRYILPIIKTLLDQSSTCLIDLDALAFCCGPGSFTGVRIGTCISQGLALGANLPMISISTLVTMAQGAWRNKKAKKVLVAIDAKMGEVYWAEYIRDRYGIWHGKNSEAVLKPEKVSNRLKKLSGEWTKVGTGWMIWPNMADKSYLHIKDGDLLLPEAKDMLPIACRMLKKKKTIPVEMATPVYIRKKEIWKNFSDST